MINFFIAFMSVRVSFAFILEWMIYINNKDYMNYKTILNILKMKSIKYNTLIIFINNIN
jgi:hypothetical protein